MGYPCPWVEEGLHGLVHTGWELLQCWLWLQQQLQLLSPDSEESSPRRKKGKAAGNGCKQGSSHRHTTKGRVVYHVPPKIWYQAQFPAGWGCYLLAVRVHQPHAQDLPSLQGPEAWVLLPGHLSLQLCQHQGLLLLQPGGHGQCLSGRSREQLQ